METTTQNIYEIAFRAYNNKLEIYGHESTSLSDICKEAPFRQAFEAAVDATILELSTNLIKNMRDRLLGIQNENKAKEI